MKPADVKSNTYIESNKEIYKDHKFKIGDIVRILKYENILKKITLQIVLKKFLWLRKLEILCREHMLLIISRGRKYWNILRRIVAKNESKQD